MGHFHFESFSEAPRTLIVSQRANKPLAWLCAAYEFEDLIAACEPADIVSLKPESVPSHVREIGLKLLEKHTQGQWTLARPYRPTVNSRYELVLFSAGNVWDLMTRSGRVRDFTRLAQLSICYIHELWASRFPLEKEYISRLQQFDVIFLGCAGSVEGLSEQTGRPCYYAPPAVDALAACPYPNPQTRCIDVLSIGRRVAEIHEHLTRHAERHPGFFYIRDTVKGLAKAHVPDARDHRRQFMTLLKRSKCFIANRPKFDQPELTKNENVIGYRVFEGAAAGCVLVGAPPVDDALRDFNEMFPWPDALIPTPSNPNRFVSLLEELESDVERLEQIRTNSVIGCLRGHDWSHRWKTILDHIGLSPTKALNARIETLNQVANQVATRPSHKVQRPAASIKA